MEKDKNNTVVSLKQILIISLLFILAAVVVLVFIFQDKLIEIENFIRNTTNIKINMDGASTYNPKSFKDIKNDTPLVESPLWNAIKDYTEVNEEDGETHNFRAVKLLKSDQSRKTLEVKFLKSGDDHTIRLRTQTAVTIPKYIRNEKGEIRGYEQIKVDPELLFTLKPGSTLHISFVNSWIDADGIIEPYEITYAD